MKNHRTTINNHQKSIKQPSKKDQTLGQPNITRPFLLCLKPFGPFFRKRAWPLNPRSGPSEVPLIKVCDFGVAKFQVQAGNWGQMTNQAMGRVVVHRWGFDPGVFQKPWRIHVWCCYIWIPSIYPSCVSIYTSTMDPMGWFFCWSAMLMLREAFVCFFVNGFWDNSCWDSEVFKIWSEITVLSWIYQKRRNAKRGDPRQLIRSTKPKVPMAVTVHKKGIL